MFYWDDIFEQDGTVEKATSSMKPPHVTIECNGNYSEYKRKVVIGWTWGWNVVIFLIFWGWQCC